MACVLCLPLFIALLIEPVQLVPVDAGVEDRGVLSDSLRLVPKDMRVQQSFEQLFRVEGTEDVYVRRAGGLYAVFRDPIYADTAAGAVPLVPTTTVYCIGEVPVGALQQVGELASPRGTTKLPEGKADTEPLPARVPLTLAPPRASGPPSAGRGSTIRFVEEEDYRRARLASFVLEALLK